MTNSTYIDQVSQIMEKALMNGAKAFSIFSGKKVEVLNATSLALNNSQISTSEDDHYILISELKGQLKGKSYLFFTSEEAKTFCAQCLPPSMANNEEMKQAILLEFDNIITAAVVTVISDLAKKNVYAYVPTLSYVSDGSIKDYIHKDYGDHNFVIQTNAQFYVEELQCNPTFIWVFDESFSTGNSDTN